MQLRTVRYCFPCLGTIAMPAPPKPCQMSGVLLYAGQRLSDCLGDMRSVGRPTTTDIELRLLLGLVPVPCGRGVGLVETVSEAGPGM